MLKLENVLFMISNTQAHINGKWVPARPINYQARSFKEKLKDAWMVYKGKADALVWPENQ